MAMARKIQSARNRSSHPNPRNIDSFEVFSPSEWPNPVPASISGGNSEGAVGWAIVESLSAKGIDFVSIIKQLVLGSDRMTGY